MKTNRGRQIEKLVNSYFKKNMFRSADHPEIAIQMLLNEKLDFGTNVSKFTQLKNNMQTMQIGFRDEGKAWRVADIYIESIDATKLLSDIMTEELKNAEDKQTEN